MKTYRCKGTMTVFLSLISVLFLSLLCTVTESARVQETRAKAAAALDMGLFSVFGEFENQVLENYDVFFLDGGCGNGQYSREALEEKLTSYMEYNLSPNKGVLLKAYDPFGVKLKEARITGVALATDHRGDAFYQQAVGFMHDNLATEAVSTWLERKNDAEKLQNAAELYEKREQNIKRELDTLEKKQKEMEEQKKEEARAAQEARNGENGAQNTDNIVQEEQKTEAVPSSKNPLEVIRKIKKKGLMGLVLGDGEASLSDKKLSSDIPSKRHLQKGTLEIKKKYSGLTSNLLFQEYLFGRFPMYTDPAEEKGGSLDYGLEYILCGKNSDRKNLKSVITRLLLMREGANFLYLTSDPGKKAEADGFAALLTGAIPIPGLQTVTSYALLLVWAYGESLLDLRELFAGGKVPVLKDAGSWKLDLKSIPDILEILEKTDGSGGEGLSYEGYLQVLFTIGSTSLYPMRALDLLEGDIRKKTGNAGFRADHAVVKMSAKAEYTIPPLFMRVSSAFLKTGAAQVDYQAEGTFAY